MEYIHYGNTKFDPDLFRPIRNEFVKPLGGMWASPVEAGYGWKDWNESSQFRECDEANSFRFTLKDGANVVHIYSVDDLKKLPQSKKAKDVVLVYARLRKNVRAGSRCNRTASVRRKRTWTYRRSLLCTVRLGLRQHLDNEQGHNSDDRKRGSVKWQGYSYSRFWTAMTEIVAVTSMMTRSDGSVDTTLEV